MAKVNYRFPYVEVSFLQVLDETQKLSFELLAGCKIKRNGRVVLPHHVMPQACELIDKLGLKIMEAEPINQRIAPKSWAQWSEILRKGGEVKEFVLDGFLTEYQRDAIEKTGSWSGTHLWHPTGAGKTLTAILWGLCKPGPILIVTRAASRLQYAREVERFTNIKPYVVRPASQYTAKQREKMQNIDEYMGDCEENKTRAIVVVGWSSITSQFESLEYHNFQTIVYDESHRGKSSKRWEAIPLPTPTGDDYQKNQRELKEQEKAARKRGGFIPKEEDPKNKRYFEGSTSVRVMIVPAKNITSCAALLSQQAANVICTTATPIKDRTRDLWAQLDLAEPYSWGSKMMWMKRYCDAKEGYYGGMDTSGSSNLEELADRLEASVHRIDYRDTHRHLPQKRRQSMYIAPEDQTRPVGGFAKQLKAASKVGGTAVLEVKLAQAASRKRKAIIGAVEDHIYAKQKVVIFTARRKDVEELTKAIKKCGAVKSTKCKVWWADGSVSATDRQEIVDKYMAHEGPCCFIGTGQSLGESLNLQDTDAAFFVMLPYTPGQLRQWEGRFCRLGQKRPVIIYYCIAESTVDEHVADILISKLPAVQAVAKDEELAEAQVIIAGMEDEEGLLNSILAKL